MDPLSFGRLWEETVAVARRHADILLPIAAAFLFLPQLLLAWRLGDVEPAQMFQGERVAGDIAMLAFLLLVSLIGQLAISYVAVRDGTSGRTVGGLLKGSALLLLPALAASLMQGMAVLAGALFLILPGLWLMARLVLTIPLLATEEPDPLRAVQKSWRLTEGRSLRILLMILMLLFGFLLVSLAVGGLGAALGVVSTVVAGTPAVGWGVGRWIFEVFAAGASAALGLLYLCFFGTLLRAIQASGRQQRTADAP